MSLTTKAFGTLPDGRTVTKYTLKNKGGCFAEFTDYGATFLSCFVPDRDGVFQDVLLGFDDMDGMLNRSSYHGQCVGRHCNRIADGKFVINGQTYEVDKNEENAKNLHSSGEFAHALWDLKDSGDNYITFSFTSPDGTFGFPGEVKAEVKYIFSDENELLIEYKAISDKATLINFTNHAYFNLAGCNSKDVSEHEIWIDADSFTPTTPDSIPTGEIRSVSDTPFDFTRQKKIGKDIDADYDQLNNAGGYDHNFCLNPGTGAKAKVYEPKSGRTLFVYTDQPGLQFYTGNFLQGEKGKAGVPMNKRAGFCLETQVYPDSPNHPEFPQCVYQAGETYTSKTVYKFGINYKK